MNLRRLVFATCAFTVLLTLLVVPVARAIAPGAAISQLTDDRAADVRPAFNPDYRSGEMLSSIQVGLRAASAESNAALIVLGDQPALERSVVQQVVAAYRGVLRSIIVPSFAMRRGHPLLIGRKHWSAILDLTEGQTLRDFMSSAAADIHHVQVDTPAILRDMDTPEDYRRELGYFIAPPARSSSTVRRPPSRG